MTRSRSLKSDNFSGVHPDIMQALVDSNADHAPSYGEDSYTEAAYRLMEEVFGKPCKTAFVFNGTGANVLSVRLCLRPYQSLLCSRQAHITTNETGAPESLAGVKVLSIDTPDGKVRPEQVMYLYHKQLANEIHAPQPRMLSVAQCTELGTVYTPEELKALREVIRQLDMYLHIDACRLYNAAVHLGCSLAEISSHIGADVISLGGTKNGAMMAEAVVVFNEDLWDGLYYLHKNTTQLYSKNRYAAAQFLALLKDDLWQRNAAHANNMATQLAAAVDGIPGVELLQKVESNHVFLGIPLVAGMQLQEMGWCYVWDDNPVSIRLVCSFDTREEDIHLFVADLRRVMATG